VKASIFRAFIHQPRPKVFMTTETLIDIIVSIAIGLLLAVGALAYFDVLVK
jgi:hypothetical protein